MVTIAGRLNKTWFGKIPVGLRWLLAIGIVIAIMVVVIKFAVASSADATAQPTAPVVAKQQASAQSQSATQNAQPVTLTPAQLQKLHNQLVWILDGAMPNDGKSPAARAENTMYNVEWSLRTKFNNAAYTVIKSEFTGPIIQEANGLNKARVRVKVEALTAPNTAKTAHEDITVYFTLDANNELKQVVDAKRN